MSEQSFYHIKLGPSLQLEQVFLRAAESLLDLAKDPQNLSRCSDICGAFLLSPIEAGKGSAIDWTEINEYLAMLIDERDGDISEYNREWRERTGREMEEYLAAYHKALDEALAKQAEQEG